MKHVKNENIPIQTVINKVKQMASYSNYAKKLAKNEGLDINTVTWEDCARNKGSSWGPCISDMTLQVGTDRMPVMREPNYTDKTWDVETDKIPLIVGNENTNPGAKLETISLREYLKYFSKYMTKTDNFFAPKINLLSTDVFAKQTDSHVIMSSQCCFLPIEKGKETKFNVALYNYQSKKQDPAVLVIVSTSKGTSAQIIEGNEQKLLFNNNGMKADFIAQRLTDNRIERNVSIHGAMTKQEKQDNCIVIIQVPLKQKPKQVHVHHFNNVQPNQNQQPPWNTMYGGYGGGGGMAGGQSMGGFVNNSSNMCGFGNNPYAPSNNMYSSNMASQNNQMYGAPAPQQAQMMNGAAAPQQAWTINNNNSNCDDLFSNEGVSTNNNNNKKKKMKKRHSSSKPKQEEKADVEAAIVKIAPKTTPICKCGGELKKMEKKSCYFNAGSVNCDGCGNVINGDNTIVWHCPKDKAWQHSSGYDLCSACGDKQLEYDELNGMSTVERDQRYPIRVTLQYYKSTQNGIVNKPIMNAIKNLLEKSQKQADYIGSLVTKNTYRPTEADLKTKNQVKVVHHVHNVVNVVHNDPFEAFGFNDIKAINKYANIENALKVHCGSDWAAYLNNFKQEEVTDDDLANLTGNDLTQLIGKMGPRNRFLKWLKDTYGDSNNFMDGFI